MTKFVPAALALSISLSACTVGPSYQKPDTADITPSQWRWQPAAPQDHAPRGPWWLVFRDQELDRLQTLALAANPTLQAAAARVDQARAGARISAANLSPNIRLSGDAKREQSSGNWPTPIPADIPSATYNSLSPRFDLSYELDLWGKVRRSLESATATAASTTASYHSVLLTLTGDVAAQYFTLRAADTETAALRRTLALRQQGRDLLQAKATAGTIPETDLARAQTEVATTQAELADLKRQRQEACDTLALLCGQAASRFQIAPHPLSTQAPPRIPLGLPSTLLERRPDIAAAERLVAARNADIGVATAAYFPSLNLIGSSGYLSKDSEALFTSDSSVWNFGPSVSLPLSGIAVLHFNVKRQQAARAEAIANYRQTILTALKDVETSLAQTRYLSEQADALAQALAASTRATELIRASYQAGTLSYFELLDAERTRLQTERQSAQVAAQRHLATVRLIKALGGSWSSP